MGRQLAMLLVLPDDPAAFDASLNASAFAAITGGLEDRAVFVLPRFGTESRLYLADILGALGLPTAFTDDADFTGITTEEPLKIRAVIHQANINVDDKGAEAAATTAVEIVAAGAPAEPVVLVVDRPFLFALRDLGTGAVLFLGRITDPSVQ